MTNEERITELAQDIYLARNNQRNDATGADLMEFLNSTIGWVNQFIPEMEKKADWNFVRTNDDTVGFVDQPYMISHPLPTSIRKLVVSPYRDLTIRQDGAVVSTFKLVNANQQDDISNYDTRNRATVLQRKIILSRPTTEAELNGDIIADSIAFIPRLSMTDVALLDLLDEYPDMRQLFVLGVLKNQILPDIVQGGLTPSYSQKYDDYLADCIAENNQTSEANQTDAESFAWVGGVGF